MDLSDEVNVKIKSAIRARLKELGIVWDRELPDYVMVLIANKKSREQMENDLNIFLGPHTSDFTLWLHNVLKKLEECAVTSKGVIKKNEEEKKTKMKRRSPVESHLDIKKFRSSETNSQMKTESDTDESSLSSHPSQDITGKSPLLRNENGYQNNLTEEKEVWDRRIENIQSYRNPDKEEPRKPREKIEINWGREKSLPRENSHSSLKSRRSNRSQSRSRSSRSKSRNRSRSGSRPGGDNSVRGVSVLKRTSRNENKHNQMERSSSRDRKTYVDARECIRSKSSQEWKNGYSKRKNRRGERGQYEKERSSSDREEKLPSLVKVTPRPIRPMSMQPPSNLILKAVADAQKSIAITSLPQPEDKLGREEKKPPINNKSNFKKKLIGSGFEPNISVTLLNDRVSSNKIDIPEQVDVSSELGVEQELGLLQDRPEVARFTISLQSDDDSMIASDLDESDINGVSQNYIEQIDPQVVQLPEPEPMETNGVCEAEVMDNTDYPVHRFDRSRLGPRVIPVVPDTDTILHCLAPADQHITKTFVNDTAFSEGSEAKSDENEKLIKCKFWPSCDAGDSCRFYHPKQYCRTLPNCKFGQKCLYYHPPCKFGEKCLNVTCPYTHGVTVSAKGKSWTKVPLAPSNGQICMFFPNCTKPFCPFQHYAASGSGIPCKYGSNCTKVACEFDHPQSSKNPYKWFAQNGE